MDHPPDGTPMVPLQLPGPIEFAVIVLAFFLLALPVVVLVGIVLAWRRLAGGTADEERVDELERRISTLEAAHDVPTNDPSDSGRRSDDEFERPDGDQFDEENSG